MSDKETVWCACGDGHEANSYGAGFMAANNGVCENCDAALHPLQQCLRENGDLIAAQATIAQQAQMIEHLRGGPTPGYTAVDMTTAAAQGFRDGVVSVVVELPSVGPSPEPPEDAIDDSYLDAHHAKIRMRNDCFKAIIAAGGRVKE